MRNCIAFLLALACVFALGGWWITVAVPDSMIETCTAFDADLNNRFYRKEDEAD